MMAENTKIIASDAGLVMLCFTASGVLSILLGQDCNWDLKNYHIYNAYALLNDRLMFDIAPAQLQTFLNPALDLPFYFAIMNLKPIWAGFIIGGVQGVNIWFVYKIAYYSLSGASERTKHTLGLAAGIIGYLGAANLSEIGTVMGDNITSLFVLGSLLLIISSQHVDENGKAGWPINKLVLSGFLMGIGTGLKMVVAVYACAFVAALLFTGSSAIPARLKNALLYGMGVCMGIITSMGYWMMTLWKNYESPLFPFYNKIFRSEYFELMNFADTRFLPRDIYQKIFYPFYFVIKQNLVSEMTFRDIRFALCYTMLIIILLRILYLEVFNKTSRILPTKDNERFAVMIITYFVISYVLWQYVFSVYRYIVPLEYLAPVFIIATVRYVFPSPKLFTGVSLALFVAIALSVYPFQWGRTSWGNSYFDIKINAPADLDRSSVVLANIQQADPLSYVIPFFPQTTRFINIKPGNFMMMPKFQARVRDLIAVQNSPLYLLLHHKHKSLYASLIEQYGLYVDDKSCGKVYSKLDEDLALCALKRSN